MEIAVLPVNVAATSADRPDWRVHRLRFLPATLVTACEGADAEEVQTQRALEGFGIELLVVSLDTEVEARVVGGMKEDERMVEVV